jgi:hypothetical protein
MGDYAEGIHKEKDSLLVIERLLSKDGNGYGLKSNAS